MRLPLELIMYGISLVVRVAELIMNHDKKKAKYSKPKHKKK